MSTMHEQAHITLYIQTNEVPCDVWDISCNVETAHADQKGISAYA